MMKSFYRVMINFRIEKQEKSSCSAALSIKILMSNIGLAMLFVCRCTGLHDHAILMINFFQRSENIQKQMGKGSSV